jgi:integrase
MNLQQHANRDDYKVWLSEQEVPTLLEHAPNASAKIAFGLGAYCGLRSFEVAKVQPDDIHDTDAGRVLRIVGKGQKYREVPIGQDLATQIQTAAEFRDDPPGYPIVQSQSSSRTVPTRTLRRWLASAAKLAAEDTGDRAWHYLSMHDLRRTWATNLAAAGVDPMILLSWGGWSDIETFRDAYRGEYAPSAHRREREKVDWL